MNLGKLRIKLTDGQTREFVIDQSPISAGRAQDNLLVIEDTSVSRRHARFSVEAGRLTVEDLGAANGTFVGGQRLDANASMLVPENQPVRLGDVEIIFTPSAPPPPMPVSPRAAAPLADATRPVTDLNKFGILSLRYPNGQTSEYPLVQPSITVGRAPENQLVIDDKSVSRHHARLSVESSRLMITDLGSANGTFIGKQRLAPNAPGLVPDNQAVKIGEVEVRFKPPVSLEAARAFVQQPAVQAAPAGAPINVSLVSPAQPVAPGSVVTAALTVQNRGAVVDELLIRVSGIPVDWVRLSKERVPLLPDKQEQITLTIQPPRRPDSTAGEHRLIVSVTSREHKTSVTAEGMVKVLPFQGFTVNIQPVRSRRDFKVMALNQGNAPATYYLTGTDDEQGLDYQFQQSTVALTPGQQVPIPLRVTPKVKPRVGARETRAFNVIATPVEAGGGAEVKAAGQLIIRPPIPLWLIPLILLIACLLCVGSTWAYLTYCPTVYPQGPFCPAQAKPVINVFTATSGTQKGDRIEIKKGDAVVLSWVVSNAETVEFTTPAQETVQASGLKTVKPEQTTTYTLRANSPFGSETKSVEIVIKGVPPVIQSFTANPASVVVGQTGKVVLSWTVSGAESVSVEGVPAQTFDPKTGNVELDVPKATTTYKLVATNAAGTVQQEVSVVISSANCKTNTDKVNLREGPSKDHPSITLLGNNIQVSPFQRDGSGKWLKVTVASINKEGWVAAEFVKCDTDVLAFPTIDPAKIPTPVPSPTPTPTLTPQPTGTPTPTPTATATPTPVFKSSGFITYRAQVGGKYAIFVQNQTGGPVKLFGDRDDVQVLDYTPQNGGLFAIWAKDGGAEKIFIVRRDGGVVRGDINPGWTSVTDGDWSIDGQHLVIEAITGGAPKYYYFNANGDSTGQPALP